ncbi:hypothetical protein [Aeribacillus alveayuensis]|uniref:Uncharacterized protein n=1 Tax=Aeribacillus alveayuensis TaxID=279215 RepID=A0ABT9VPJ9_9BACI|nr:hypothetical protein [Bacillus alveayuensis]
MAEKDMHHQERSFHPDGRYEGIIDDSAIKQKTEMGVKIDLKHKRFKKKNPYHLSNHQRKEMERFEQLMEGHKKNLT